MSPRRRLAFSVLLAAVLLWLFFRGIRLADLGAALSNANPLYLAGAVSMTVLTYLVRSWRWGGLLRPLVRVPYGRLFSVTIVGFMAGLIVPRAGEILRPYLIARRHGVATSAAFASIILERLFDLITVLLLFGLYLFVLPPPAAARSGPLMQTVRLGGGAVALGALLVLGVLILAHARAEWVARAIEKIVGFLPGRIAAALSRMARSFLEGLAVLRAPVGHIGTLLAQSLLTWLCIDLTVHWTNRALGIDLPFRSTFLIIAFLTVGVAVPTPGNVGGYHATYLLALTQAFGVDKPRAVAAGLLSHLCFNLPVLLMGLWFMRQEGLTLSGVAHVTQEDTP